MITNDEKKAIQTAYNNAVKIRQFSDEPGTTFKTAAIKTQMKRNKVIT